MGTELEPTELEDEDWDEVLGVLRDEAENRGISTDDFPEMLLLIKKLWKLLTNKGQRQSQAQREKRRRLEDARDRQTEQLEKIREEIDKLPPVGPRGGGGPPGRGQR